MGREKVVFSFSPRNLFTQLENYTRSDVAKDFLIPDSGRNERKATLMGTGDRVQQG